MKKTNLLFLLFAILNISCVQKESSVSVKGLPDTLSINRKKALLSNEDSLIQNCIDNIRDNEYLIKDYYNYYEVDVNRQDIDDIKIITDTINGYVNPGNIDIRLDILMNLLRTLEYNVTKMNYDESSSPGIMNMNDFISHLEDDALFSIDAEISNKTGYDVEMNGNTYPKGSLESYTNITRRDSVFTMNVAAQSLDTEMYFNWDVSKTVNFRGVIIDWIPLHSKLGNTAYKIVFGR